MDVRFFFVHFALQEGKIDVIYVDFRVLACRCLYKDPADSKIREAAQQPEYPEVLKLECQT